MTGTGSWGQRPRSSWPPGLLRKILLGTLLVLLAGGLVMFLWNAILPEVLISARPLSYPQGVGLLLLCKLLFYNGGGYPRHTSAPPPRPRQLLPEEDRAAFMARIRQRLAEAEKDDGSPGLIPPEGRGR